MKNKKILKALAALTMSAAAAGCMTLFGCAHEHTFSEEWKNDDPSGHWHVATCGHDVKGGFAEHEYDDETDATCNVCGYTRELPEPATQYTVTFHMNGYGTQLEATKVNENGKLEEPEPPEHSGKFFLGWYTDSTLKTVYDFNSAVTEDLDLYARWEDHLYDLDHWAFDLNNHYHACTESGCNEVIDLAAHTLVNNVCTVCGAQLKQATYEFESSDLDEGTYSDGVTSGIFSVLADTKIRTRSRENTNVYNYENGYYGDSDEEPVATGFYASKSIQFDGSARGFSVNAIAPGKLTFYVDNGSGNKTSADYQTLLLTKPDGSQETLSYCCVGLYAITIDCDEVGTYKITRGSAAGVGTSDVYYIKYETTVLVTPVEKIEVVEKGTVEYFAGQTLDLSKLQVNLIRQSTGMIEPIDFKNLEIDDSDFDNTKAGTYNIKIAYTDDDGNEFTASYTVSVYDVEGLELGFNAIIPGNNTSYGNGTYINHTVKQFYFKGEDLNLDGLTVKTLMNEGEMKVIVNEGFEISGYDKNTAGKQRVRITWTANPEIFAEFDVYVAEYASVDPSAESVTINVNAAVTDAAVGTIDNGAYQFKTIQQALDFLKNVNYDENTKKLINLAEGTYKEKIEINIPNLTMRGADSDSTKTVIEWDSLYGIADEGGFVHTTDSTATLNVREAAVGFVIENITISNWFNSTEHFDEAMGAGYAEHRALAVLIQADKVVVDNCRMLGYQDTLELFTGRQLIQNTYICGRTDFIFGTNNTTYFYNCEIESIVSGGYVTAFKGNNKDKNDAVIYGAIFDRCNFTAPDDVIAKADTSLGRTWGEYAAVAVINSTLGGHISKYGYGAKDENNKALPGRYTAMSGNEPTDSTVKFVEYNNTGNGALDEAVAGMRMLSATEAANYSNKEVFFAATNGGVTYTSAWDGNKGVEITEKTYKFNSETFPDGDFRENDVEATNNIFDGEMTVRGAWHTELGTGKDFGWFNAGTTITLNEQGKVTVSTYGSSYGLPENVKIIYINGKAVISIIATVTSPISNGCCITQIVLDKADVPEDTTVFKVNVYFEETVLTTFDVIEGDGISADSIKALITGEAFEGMELDKVYTNSENTTEYDFSAINTETSLYLTVKEKSAIKAIGDEVDLTKITETYQGDNGIGKYDGVEIDATASGAKLGPNGNWPQFSTGTILKIKVEEGATVQVTEYQNAGKITISERDEDGYITITATADTYISKITVVAADTTKKIGDEVDFTKLTETYQGSNGTYDGVEIDATASGAKLGPNGAWPQFNAGTILKIKVEEGATVQVTEYQDAGKISISERDEDGYITITATANTYISKITVVAA